MSMVAIIPIENLLEANSILAEAGHGEGNFHILTNSEGEPMAIPYAVLHTWSDPIFEENIKAIPNVIWEESDGDPMTRINTLIGMQE